MHIVWQGRQVLHNRESTLARDWPDRPQIRYFTGRRRCPSRKVPRRGGLSAYRLVKDAPVCSGQSASGPDLLYKIITEGEQVGRGFTGSALLFLCQFAYHIMPATRQVTQYMLSGAIVKARGTRCRTCPRYLAGPHCSRDRQKPKSSEPWKWDGEAGLDHRSRCLQAVAGLCRQ